MADGLTSALSGAGTGAGIGTAIMPGWGTGIGALLGAGAGVAGWFLTQASEEEAAKITKQALDKYGEISADSIRKAMGDVLGPTKLAEIQADPGYQEAQDTALAELKRISDSGGMTLEDKANFNAALARSGQQQSQLRRAALEGLRSRGLQSAGAETQMDIAGQQAAANAASQAGVQALAESQRRALEAISRRGQMAGQMQQAKYGREAEAARAQDVINQLNWGNRTNQYGAEAQRAANLYNMARGQAADVRGAGQQEARNAANIFGGLGQFATGYDAERMAEERAARAAQQQQTPTQPAVSTSSYGGLGSDPFSVGALNSPVSGLGSSEQGTGVWQNWNKKDGD